MKEIIEKYKRGELKLCEYVGEFGTPCIGDMISIGRSKSPWNIADFKHYIGHTIQYADCLILESVMINKEIEAMEKQPTEYEYVQCEYERLSNAIRDFEDDALWRKVNEDYFQIEGVHEILDCFNQCDIYRRIPLTPEQLHERKVEELKDVINNAMSRCQCRRDEPLAAAKAALEWMESKGK